ncbi:hypothetical protein BDW69DRAFT_204128 [Aspergillus filifer]
MAAVAQHEHGFAFVSVNKLGKTRPTDRKTIRSHCMRGKNRTIGLGPRVPKGASPSSTFRSSSSSSLSSSSSSRLSADSASCSSGLESRSRFPALVSPSASLLGLGYSIAGNGHNETGNHLHPNQYSLGVNEEKHENEKENTFTLDSEPHTLTTLYTPSTLSLLHFAFDVSNDDKAFLLDFLNAFTSTMYPTTAFTEYNIATCPWASWPFTDASYLQCIFFMASVLRDLALFASVSVSQRPSHSEKNSKPITAKTYAALRNTIIYLNNRLSHPDRNVSLADSTIAVVVILTMFCCMIGDHDGAREHVKGLKMLVFLRGGTDGFAGSEKLAIKLSRVDLVYALNSGTQGVFCTRPIQAAYTPGLQGPGLGFGFDIIHPSTAGDSIYGFLDDRLLPIFLEMQHYSALINAAHATRQRRTVEEYHRVVCSFQYRLLQMEGVLEDGLSECLRLAMLAFLITTFQFPGTRAEYPYLATCLRRACCEVMGNEAGACRTTDIMGWVMIVGAISVFDINVEEEWMKMMWQFHVNIVDWFVMREKVKSIMWVDVLQDAAGQVAFQQLNELCLR